MAAVAEPCRSISSWRSVLSSVGDGSNHESSISMRPSTVMFWVTTSRDMTSVYQVSVECPSGRGSAEPRQLLGELPPPPRPVVRDVVAPDVELVRGPLLA